MNQVFRFLARLALVSITAAPALADTVNVSTRPNGEVSFDVSLNGATRISVVGDRIVDLRQASTNFEMSEEERLGDIYLRFAGGQATQETGYLITEGGHTIAVVMTPKADLDNQTVLITLRGVQPATTRQSSGAGGSAAPASSGFAVNSGGAGSSRTARLVQFARQAYAARIGNRSASGRRVGSYRSYSAGGLTARVTVASAPGNQPPAERQFYQSSKTLAVFVDRVVSGGKVWVIIVEGS